MFKPRLGEQTEKEVSELLKQIRAKNKLKILDLCCGEGRHSILLSKKGHDVTGLDYSDSFLKTARSQAKRQKTPIKFIKGDMKMTSKVLDKNYFNAVFSLYNSFGYFDKRADDFRVLKEVAKVLKPNGYFVINTINGTGAKLRLEVPISKGIEFSKKLFMIDSAYLDLKKMRTHSDWTIIDARKSKTSIFRGSFEQNIYHHKELKRMLKQAGFKIIKTWGVLQGGDFDEKKSWHQTILAQKT